ncbi:hypothetical protein [Corynebacterium diphtheriae]|uniref:hypothetical protein n=1 Tax=Corynebacterium diphtheriae TaxID=1717 RepID=UPI000B68FB52|nr:hypothetical protein [Corynebacterium diphtheriae]OWM42915.1 hypothetical protein BU164_10810 [Corynebacterium diphtheriae]OWM49499.1 hypothetical protein BU163_06705 [Corynebacterium diphtheriae]OWN42865.1 hypothetical protein AY507_08405 [Corynebacterium diphtheriae bv. mitis]OWN61559.1 hypothetical protein AY521_06750 [Corynebacterium diphtheriae bv. mitis]OWN77625.1 hypothetical protein AY509_07535 [Corynebacterium diphtheriae bv. mitis]
MEDVHVKSLKSAARRGAMISVAAASALALASCSAGQITQTSDQVAAVDGSEVDNANGTIALRDVTISLTEQGQAGVKFTAINQDNSNKEHVLKSITVDGTKATIDGNTKLASDCSIVGGIKAEISQLTEPKAGCITHVITSVENKGLAVGGSKNVVFSFDSGDIALDATIAAPVLESGQHDRQIGGEHANHSH